VDLVNASEGLSRGRRRRGRNFALSLESAMSEFPGVVLIDGQLVPKERAVVSVFDRGFLYGDSVFETMRSYAGVALDLERHLERLERSVRALEIQLTVSLDDLATEIQRALRLVPPRDAVVRVTQTRGVGPLAQDPAVISGGSRIVTVMPFEPYPRQNYEKGIVAAVLSRVKPARLDLPCEAKHGNYLHAVLARRHVRNTAALEVILLDDEGFVAEGATSNVLWVRGQKLCVPPPDGPILAGITQRALLELGQDLGFTIEYQRVLPSELCGFDEVMISSSLREVLPLVAIDARPVGSGEPGPVHRALRSAYQARTDRYVNERLQSFGPKTPTQ
jgi:branched-chain amino acid aminotransferase